MRFRQTFAAALGALLLTACSPVADDYAGDPAAEIAAVESAQLDAIAADDADAAAAAYAADAVIRMGDEEPLEGTEAIRAAYEDVLADPYFDYVVTPGTLEVNEAQDRAVANGRYTSSASPEQGEGVIVTTGTAETVWVRRDGMWQIAEVTTVQDPPEVPAAAAGIDAG